MLVPSSRHRQEGVRDVPELVAVVAEDEGVRGAGEHDELPVGVGQCA